MATRTVPKPPYADLLLDSLDVYLREIQTIYTQLKQKEKAFKQGKTKQKLGEKNELVLKAHGDLCSKFRSPDVFSCMTKMKVWIKTTDDRTSAAPPKQSKEPIKRIGSKKNQGREETFAQRDDIFEKLQLDFLQLKQQMDELVQRNSKQENELWACKMQLDQYEKELQQLSQQNAELTTYVSQEMNTRLSSNEQNMENINIINRPMNIVEEYVHFTSNEWSGAMNELDELFHQTNKKRRHQFLSDILLIASGCASKAFGNLMRHLQTVLDTILWNPLSFKDLDEPESENKKSSSEKENKKLTAGNKLTTEGTMTESVCLQVTNAIGDFLRSTADDVPLNSLIQDIKREVSIQSQHTEMQNMLPRKDSEKSTAPLISMYVREAALLTWKMALQRPPMTFETPSVGQLHNSKIQDVYFESDDPKRYPVQYYVYPILKHGDQMMAKGKVVCG